MKTFSQILEEDNKKNRKASKKFMLTVTIVAGLLFLILYYFLKSKSIVVSEFQEPIQEETQNNFIIKILKFFPMVLGIIAAILIYNFFKLPKERQNEIKDKSIPIIGPIIKILLVIVTLGLYSGYKNWRDDR